MLLLLTLAPVSVASAEPVRPDRGPDHVYERDRYDGRHDRGRYERHDDRDRRSDRWFGRRRLEPIVQGSSASSERQFHNVLGRGGRFGRLVVEGVRGAPVIERVAVEFEDRQTQVWDVNRRLTRGADEVIDLGQRKRIHRIVVYTNPTYRGAYSIYGA
jgi:hypothetical protein